MQWTVNLCYRRSLDPVLGLILSGRWRANKSFYMLVVRLVEEPVLKTVWAEMLRGFNSLSQRWVDILNQKTISI